MQKDTRISEDGKTIIETVDRIKMAQTIQVEELKIGDVFVHEGEKYKTLEKNGIILKFENLTSGGLGQFIGLMGEVDLVVLESPPATL